MTAWLSVRVMERRAEAQDIVALVLAPLPGEGALPAFEAGAHVDVQLPGGLVRQYSLCGEAGRCDRYQIAVLLEPDGRGGSRAVHETVAVGDTIGISPPRNLFPLVPGQPALLFAGGIGITPILAMAETLAASGIDFAAHYCTRSAARMAFAGRIAQGGLGDRFVPHFDDRPETRLDMPAILAATPRDRHLYVCGPNGFMAHVLDAARAAHWPEAQLHWEHFAPAATDGEAGFEIEIAATGQVIAVPGGSTALDALIAAGFDIPRSCEVGICGSCLTPVLSGVPDHRDMYLSPAERAANDCFTPCCSRAATPRLTVQI